MISERKIKLALFLTLLASSLVAKPLIILCVFLFPSLFLFKIRLKSLLILIPLFLTINWSLVIVGYIFFSFLNIPADASSVLIFLILISTIFSLVNPKFDIPPPKNWSFIILVYGLFAAALFSRFFNLTGLEVPPLHDPEAHAWYTKLILDSKDIEYFYSPGLHAISAFTSEILSVGTGKSVHLVTQLASALGVLTWSMSFFILTRNKWAGFSAGFFYLIAPLPALFFANSGKNALVVAIALLPLAFPLLLYTAKRTNLTSLFALVTLVVVVGLIHYPTAIFLEGFILLGLVASLLRIKARSHKSKKKIFSLFILLASLPMLILYGWTLHTQPFDQQSSSNLNENQAVALRGMELKKVVELQNKSSQEIKNTLNANIPSGQEVLCPANFIDKLTCKGQKVYAQYKSQPSYVSRIVIFILILFSLIVAIATIRQVSSMLSLMFFLSFFGLTFALSFIQIQSLYIVELTGYLLLYVSLIPLLAVSAGTLLRLFDRKSKVLLIVLLLCMITVAIYSTAKIYRSLENREKVSSFVSGSDIEAFQWINANIGDGEGFINDALTDPRRPAIVFPIDGGLWLPVYTDNPTALVFHESGFANIDNHINYYFYRQFTDSGSAESLEQLNKRGFSYYYDDFGSNSASDIPIERLNPNKIMIKKIYSNDGVNIWKLEAF